MTSPIGPGQGPGRHRVVLTMGKFDGVHAGHRELVAHVLDAAGADAVPAALMIHPNPASVLAGRSIPILTDIPERRARLRGLGIDRAEVLEFTRDLSKLEPEAFVERLQAHFELDTLVVGAGFAFGRDRSGDTDTLRRLGSQLGFGVVEVPALNLAGGRISSGRCRELIEAGDVQGAWRLLRAPPLVSGTVVRGAARGRELGYPTANLALREDYVVPANGIYTVRAEWRSGRRDRFGRPVGEVRRSAGVASVGVRPTFDNGHRLVEVYLLDFEGDLYGRELLVEFLARQRSEERFDSVGALVTQMARDVDVARANLAAQARWRGELTNRKADGQGTDAATATGRGVDLAMALEHAIQARLSAAVSTSTDATVTLSAPEATEALEMHPSPAVSPAESRTADKVPPTGQTRHDGDAVFRRLMVRADSERAVAEALAHQAHGWGRIHVYHADASEARAIVSHQAPTTAAGHMGGALPRGASGTDGPAVQCTTARATPDGFVVTLRGASRSESG